jgi:hypothetical protein
MDLKNIAIPSATPSSFAARHRISAEGTSPRVQSHTCDISQRRRLLISVLDEALELIKDGFDDTCNQPDASSSNDSCTSSQ